MVRVLHISFHKGCQNEIQYICDKLGIYLEFMEFDDGITKTNSKYNISKNRANNCWNKYKTYFNSFDIIITSDTAPISRVFLQNNFKKKLIIWVCNRFDYKDNEHLDCIFPDKEYYNLIRGAIFRSNVLIIGYTKFENFYANILKQVFIGNVVIKPIGNISSIYNIFNETVIENKQNTFFVPPYHNDTIMINLPKILSENNILTYSGKYNGPLDLINFKGVIHVPYAWSNLALFEGISNGIIYFIPSIKFFMEIKKNNNFFWSPPYKDEWLKISEWYCKENSNIFVYFDSWSDLYNKIHNLDYVNQRELILKYSKIHEKKNMKIWKQLLI